MGNPLGNDWQTLLDEEFHKPYYLALREFLEEEYASGTIYPEAKDICNALQATPYQEVKAVILGQDPYHGPGQAHGLSFSVKPDVQVPPSLRNIYKELREDIGCDIPDNGYLMKWAEQGVLMLNTVLTVRAGEAHSHRGKGWETFTDRIISLISERDEPAVFILWGKPAQSKLALIDTKKHNVIKSAHPSPLSASKGFFGSRPFSKVNAYLRSRGLKEIDWQIPNVRQ